VKIQFWRLSQYFETSDRSGIHPVLKSTQNCIDECLIGSCEWNAVAEKILRLDEGRTKNQRKVTSDVTVRPWLSPSCARFRTWCQSVSDAELNGLQSDAAVCVGLVSRTKPRSKTCRNSIFEISILGDRPWILPLKLTFERESSGVGL
jgi:hypothetical protein